MVGREALVVADTLTELRERFLNSVAVLKIKEGGARRVLISDKDGSIQKYPKPVAEPLEREVQAGYRLRKQMGAHPFLECSAQTLDLSVDSAAYWASRPLGFRRAQPTIVMPDGSVVRDPGLVPGWGYHLNPDGFLGYGTGNYYRLGDGYFADTEYEALLGGNLWRPSMFKVLDEIYTSDAYHSALRRHHDVEEHAFRLEFDHTDRAEVDFLRLHIDRARLLGKTNAVWVDESRPGKSYTTYVVPEYAQKAHAVERFGNALSYYSGVPSSELEYIYIGDQGHDVDTAIKALQGAKEVTLIVPADSPMVARIETNGEGTDEQWGYPLPGGPNDYDKDYRGFYGPTDEAGIYIWHGLQPRRTRRVILAEQTSWFEPGMSCTESVVATLDHLGFR